jgi:hypothetical protein
MINAMATPFVAPLYEQEPTPPDLARANAQLNESDPHLRSIAAVTGYHINASDGEIGHVEDFLVDDAGWSIRYIKVDTRNWWPGERVLISPRSVREIDWADKLIHLDVSRQEVKDSPSYDPSITVDGAYEEKFLTRHQMARCLASDGRSAALTQRSKPYTTTIGEVEWPNACRYTR